MGEEMNYVFPECSVILLSVVRGDDLVRHFMQVHRDMRGDQPSISSPGSRRPPRSLPRNRPMKRPRRRPRRRRRMKMKPAPYREAAFQCGWTSSPKEPLGPTQQDVYHLKREGARQDSRGAKVVRLEEQVALRHRCLRSLSTCPRSSANATST